MQTLNYVETKPKFNNKNETVLFLYGWGGSTSSFFVAQNYLSANYHTISIDFSGFGKSPQPKKPLDTYEYALQVYEFLKNKNINNIYIVSHSFGGRIAILLSTIFNLKVEKMVLVACAGLKPRRKPSYFIRVQAYKFLRAFVKQKMLPRSVLKMFGSNDYKRLNKVMKQSLIRVVNQDLKLFLPQVKAKTLLVWGKKDKDTPLYMAKTMRKLISNSELVVFKPAGHFVHLQFYDKFNGILLKFLRN